MRTREQIIFEQNSKMTEARARCWGCRNYILERDGSGSCVIEKKAINIEKIKKCSKED